LNKDVDATPWMEGVDRESTSLFVSFVLFRSLRKDRLKEKFKRRPRSKSKVRLGETVTPGEDATGDEMVAMRAPLFALDIQSYLKDTQVFDI
jgi:hypothetical protein